MLASDRRNSGTAPDASSVDKTGSADTESDDHEGQEHSRVSSTNKNIHMDNDILIEIPKGPNKGKCLARLIHQQQLSRSTPWIPQTLGRATSRLLWSDTDMTKHMLSPTG